MGERSLARIEKSTHCPECDGYGNHLAGFNSRGDAYYTKCQNCDGTGKLALRCACGLPCDHEELDWAIPHP